MAAFFTDVPEAALNPVFLKKVGKKFHYEEKQLPELRAVAERMLPLIRREAFWAAGKSCICGGADSSVNCEDVVMSLGGGIDLLQEDFAKKGLLCECYMLEALASELLLLAYQAYNQSVRGGGVWHVARYHFPGAETGFPLERLPEMLKNLTSAVVCNEAFCMLPKKSVAFVAELTRDEEIQCGGICQGCDSENCPNRIEDSSPPKKTSADLTLNYGYSRIFGGSFQTGI
ncbi:MAG: hypothetical protein NC432_07800 [Roseburia sp.]|nr:hypothetical protein [Roseburia sp.]MCM1097838.1 hypothetical protein [Ruminococcus flavefaciens]